MDSVSRMLAEWQCTQLCYRFAHCLDTGNFETMFTLFTEDGVFDRVGQILRGREQMRLAFQERPAVTSRHLVTNVHFLNVEEDRAEAHVYNISYHALGHDPVKPLVYAKQNGRCIDFHDHYQKIGDQWLFVSRVAKAIFVSQDWDAPAKPTG